MPIEISEMRPSDQSEVAQLLEASANQQPETPQIQNTPEPSGAGDTPPQPEAAVSDVESSISRFDNTLSLVARENGQLVGVILCRRDGTEGYLHDVTVASSHQAENLDKALINRALGKLNAKGSNKTRIKLPPGPEHTLFWNVVKWSNIEELNTDPIRSSAVTERLAAGRYEEPTDDQETTDTPPKAPPAATEAVTEQAA